MRVFVGIAIPLEARKLILAKLERLQKKHTPIRWTAIENIHLTLKFLGEMTPELYARTEGSLAAPWDGTRSFSASIHGFGKFPAGPRLSIVWVGVEPSPALMGLQAEIERRLEAFPFPREVRGYSPHVTLGRNKAAYNFKGFMAELDDLADEPVAAFGVNAFQIFRSQLAPTGPVYTVKKEIPLV